MLPCNAIQTLESEDGGDAREYRPRGKVVERKLDKLSAIPLAGGI